MPKPTTRETTGRDARPAEDRLSRLLDSPLLARIVPHLAPEALHQLVQHRGLDACAELVTLATPAQLTSLLDLDLWRGEQPGRDEHFDVSRFGEWLEVLVEAGESAAARTVAGLDTDLVVLGLSHYVRVFDPGIFEPTALSDDERADSGEMMNGETSGDGLECELGGYLLRARRTDAWDAIVMLLVALDTEHQDYFHAVMQGCRRLSNSPAEIDGLDDLLTAPEQQLHDAAVEREARRSRRGYATPADARAFLQAARQPLREAHGAGTINVFAAAWFRDADEEADRPPEAMPPPAHCKADETPDHRSESNEAMIEWLTGAGLVPDAPLALLEAGDEEYQAARLPLLRQLIEFVLHHDEAAYFARGRELAFLANTLVAGSSVQSRAFTAQEASTAAACICNLGLECWRERGPGAHPPAGAFLVDHDLVTAFQVGWSVLYQDVSLFAADRLITTLADLHVVDTDVRRELHALERTLVKEREAGTPWRARDAAEVLAMLDMTVWISVLGLLDECPVLPAALTAILERRTTSVSPTAFEFISTAAQIGDIRVFMRSLPGLLTR